MLAQYFCAVIFLCGSALQQSDSFLLWSNSCVCLWSCFSGTRSQSDTQKSTHEEAELTLTADADSCGLLEPAFCSQKLASSLSSLNLSSEDRLLLISTVDAGGDEFINHMASSVSCIWQKRLLASFSPSTVADHFAWLFDTTDGHSCADRQKGFNALTGSAEFITGDFSLKHILRQSGCEEHLIILSQCSLASHTSSSSNEGVLLALQRSHFLSSSFTEAFLMPLFTSSVLSSTASSPVLF